MPYDVVNDPTAPERLGVSAGKYTDGTVRRNSNCSINKSRLFRRRMLAMDHLYPSIRIPFQVESQQKDNLEVKNVNF